MKRGIFIATLVFLLVSCGHRKQMRLTELSSAMIESYWANQLNYKYLTLKSKVTFIDNGNTTNAAGTFRMKKDSILWASFGLLGFEGARVLITQDSFKLINRMNNTYMARSADYLRNIVGFDVKLGELQDIMVGNAPFSPELYRLITTDSIQELQAQKGLILNTVGMNTKLQSVLSNFSSTVHIQSADFTYDEYKKFDSLMVPTVVKALLFLGDRSSNLELNYLSVSSEPIESFPFSVPSNFKRI